DDREVLQSRNLTYFADGLHAIHFGHHDIHEHELDIGLGLEHANRDAAIVGRYHLHRMLFEDRRQREDVAHVVVYDQNPTSAQNVGRSVQLVKRFATTIRELRHVAVE